MPIGGGILAIKSMENPYNLLKEEDLVISILL